MDTHTTIEVLLETVQICYKKGNWAAYTKDRPVLSSERAPHKNKTVTAEEK
jgi:hypothetical protein